MKELLLMVQPGIQTSQDIAYEVEKFGANLGLPSWLVDILGALLLLIVGFFVAKLIGGLIRKAVAATGVDRKTNGVSIAKLAGKFIYYLIMIIVLIAVLSLFGISNEVTGPLNSMLAKFFSAIPNIIAAGVIAYVGYFLAKLVSELVAASGDTIRGWLPSMYNKSGLDKATNYDGDSDTVRPQTVNTVDEDPKFDIVNILKNIVFVFIFVPILIIALEKLDMHAITEPATRMLDTFINAIPDIIYALVILAIAVIGGKYIKMFIQNLLRGFDLNDLSKKLSLDKVLGNLNLENLIGNLVYFFIVYVGITEAAQILGLHELVEILDTVIELIGRILFGLIILVLGNVVANIAVKVYNSGNNTNKYVGSIIRAAILVIFLSMGLHYMGIADDIVELAFGLGLGAVAVAFALAFGLGGREAAGRELEDFFRKMKKKDDNNTPTI